MESSTRSASRLLSEPLSTGVGAAPAPRGLRPAGITGLGSFAPARILTNHDLEQIVETSHDWIVTRTGICERRIAGPDESTADLALNAAQRALADAELPASELDLILVASVTTEHLFPATANTVQAALGANRSAAFDLRAACSGFVYGCAVATQFVQTGMYRNVLVVGAEALSRITNWRDRTTCVLFGDGAGAAVIGPVAEGQGFLAFDLGSDGSGGELLSVNPGGWGHPLTTGSDAALHQSIEMAGGEVFKFAVRVMEESTLRTLDRAGLTLADVDLLIPHQANIRIIDNALKRLGFPAERVYNNVDRYGNTSAASIPLALDEARAQGRLRPGDTVALVGFGAGLTWASTVLNWTGRLA